MTINIERFFPLKCPQVYELDSTAQAGTFVCPS
jgi:hypothetical protein